MIKRLSAPPSMIAVLCLLVLALTGGCRRAAVETDSTIDLLDHTGWFDAESSPLQPEEWREQRTRRWTFDDDSSAPAWKRRVYRGEMRVGVEEGSGVDGTASLCMQAEQPADADAQTHVIVSPNTDYRFTGYLRTEDLVRTTAKVFGTFYLGEFEYGHLANFDYGDSTKWHFDLQRRRGTTDWRRFQYEFRTADHTRMIRIAASLGNWGKASGRVCIDDVALTPISDPPAVGTVRRIEVGREIRRALPIPAGSSLRRRLRVPEKALLRFGVGVQNGTGPVGDVERATFRVSVVDGEESVELLRHPVSLAGGEEAQRWQDLSLDLGAYAQRDIELVFTVDEGAAVSSPAQVAVGAWSNPTVFTADRGGDRDPDILLLTVDTLRPDHLGMYGYRREVSPSLDALARDGVVFDSVFTTVPRTTPALASLMTATYPRRHELRTLLDRMPAAKVTLAETLEGNGYATGAIVTSNTARQSALDQGFDTFDDNYRIWVDDPRARAGVQVDRALRWLTERRHLKKFLWLHVWDPHFPYDPPAPYDRVFDPDFNGVFDLYERLGRRDVTPGQVHFQNDLDARQQEHMIARYDGEILYTDTMIGKVLARLRELGLYENSMIVFSSDHAESLGEHDYFYEHGDYLYEPTMRIPLVVKFPGGRYRGQRVGGHASILDIAPTILAAAGLELESIDGRDVSKMIESDPGETRLTFGETGRKFFPENPRRPVRGLAGHWKSVRSESWKLIEIPTADGADHELYRIDTDPGETSNLADDNPAVADKLKRQLHDWLSSFDSAPSADIVAPSAAEQERLRALGYMN